MEKGENFIEVLAKGVEFEMVFVEGGEFMMGDDDSDYDDEKPAHRVSLDDFCIGKYLVTQRVWLEVMGKNPSYFEGLDRPMETVSWNDIQDFLQELKNQTGRGYRLPTEAEWEYAARGGHKSLGFLYAGSDKLEEVGWFVENSDIETKHVGLLFPNELGLYDMSGNVDEWCQDWYDGDYYKFCAKQGVVHNPQGPDNGGLRVVRGGYWATLRSIAVLLIAATMIRWIGTTTSAFALFSPPVRGLSFRPSCELMRVNQFRP